MQFNSNLIHFYGKKNVKTSKFGYFHMTSSKICSPNPPKLLFSRPIYIKCTVPLFFDKIIANYTPKAGKSVSEALICRIFQSKKILKNRHTYRDLLYSPNMPRKLTEI